MDRTDKLEMVLADGVLPMAEACGFKFVRSKRWFVRNWADRRDLFDLLVKDRGDHLVVQPGVGIRFHQVETTFHRTSRFPPGTQADTNSVGVDLWRVHGEAEAEIPINSGDDLELAIHRINVLFETHADAFFQRFKSIEAIDAAVNCAPFERCLVRLHPPLRCATGTIVARMLARSDLPNLVSAYRQVLSSIDHGFYLPEYLELVRDLGLPSE